VPVGYRWETIIFYSVLWQATKVGFTVSTLKRRSRAWNSIIWIHQQKRNERQCHHLTRFWAPSSVMQRGSSWLNIWNLGKQILLVMSTLVSFVVHCAINIAEERSSCSTITLGFTLLVRPWKKREHGFGCSPSLSVRSWSCTLRLPTLWFCEESDARPTLRDERGTPDSHASMSSGSWNGVLTQGNIQTSRKVGKMCTDKPTLCRKKQTSMD